MEYAINDDIKNYFYDNLLDSSFNFFEKINSNYKDEKQFMPVLLNCGNSFLSNLLINRILHSMFPNDKLLTSNYEHKLSSNKNTVFNVKMSKNHVEVNPSEYGINDRSIVGEFLAEASSMKNIVTGNKKNIVIWNIDKLGVIAFESLHNVIKNNEDTANFICITNDITKIDPSILSVVNQINIKKPTDKFYLDFFKKYNADEDANDLLDCIRLGFNNYDFNIFLKNIGIRYNFNKKIDNKNSFKHFIQKFYFKITNKSKITDTLIEDIRNTLYDLYVYHFNYEEIVNIFLDLVWQDSRISENNKRHILDKACHFSSTCSKGNKQVIHLEGFVFNFMQIFWGVRKNKA